LRASWEQVRLELHHTDHAVSVRVKRVEHFLVDVELLSGALLEAEGAESALKLPHVEVPVAIGIKLHEDGAQIPAVANGLRL